MGHIYQENEIMAGAYQIIGEIGRGGAGVIYLAYHLRLNKYVVIKRISSASRSTQFLRDEADIMKNLHHPGLPQVYDYIVEQDAVYTVMDYIDGTDLSKIPVGSNNISEAQMIQWLRQIAEVLEYLHSRQVTIIHSDIKPQNIILRTDGTLCLIDFNISLSEGESAKVKGVSEEFASPEQIMMADIIRARRPIPFKIDVRTDIYSLGATFYYLTSGLHPSGRKPNHPLKNIKELGYSKGLAGLIDSAMAWDRENRYSSASALIKAIDLVQKRDANYYKRLILKSAAIAALGLAIGGSAFLFVKEQQSKLYEEYSNSYTQLSVDVVSNNTQDARKEALEILNKASYQKIFKKDPTEKAKVEASLADVYYYEGAYSTSAEYYRMAIADAEGSKEIQDYYRGYVRALMQDGKSGEAKIAITEARGRGCSDDEIALMEIIVLGKGDNYEALKKALSDLTKSTSSAEIKRTAYLEASMAAFSIGECEDTNAWAKESMKYGETIQAARLMGEASLLITTSSSISFGAKEQLLREAINSYEYIDKNNSLSKVDCINYSSALIEMNRSSDALVKLSICENKYGEAFYISKNKAFAYNQLGDSVRALENCKRAMTLFNKMSESDKSQCKEDMTNLEKLLKCLQ